MGKSPKTFVEINGKKYDAITGKPVEDSVAPGQLTRPKPDNATLKQTKQNGGSLGGVIAPSGPKSRAPNPPPTHSKDMHSRTSKGHSLHRSAAKQVNPTTALPAENHGQTQEGLPRPARRHLAQGVDQARLDRSSKHSKSSAIAKFSNGQPELMREPQTEPLTVTQGEPNTTPAISPKEELIAKRLAQAAANQPPIEQKPPSRVRFSDKLKGGRSGSVVAASLAALLLIGYVTYLNIPRMALRVAAGRAGFSAELPGYAPSGFRFSGPVAYSPGELTLLYASNSDDRFYQIKEQETDWDSQTLLDKFVVQETELYSTYQERGLTIYVYGGSIATWINGGIWYTISGESQLTSEQLLKIAASL